MYKVLKNGLMTGLMLQLAVGPVFFFITNLALQKTVFDGLAGALAVTLVDYTYITLAILGIGKLLEYKRVKKIFGIISSTVLSIFGLLILKGVASSGVTQISAVTSSDLVTSFSSVFFLTITSPMTIVFFTSLFTTKAVEFNYTNKELYLFGFGTGLATLLFMSSSVLVFSLLRGNIPQLLVQVLNAIVGCVLVFYGFKRLLTSLGVIK